MSKINILVICIDTVGGVGFYRCLQPHCYIQNNYSDDFNITIETNPDFNNIEKFGMYDIVFFHKGVFYNQEAFFNVLQYCKNNNIITIVDVDDYWELNSHHPQYIFSKKRKDSETVKKILTICDYVTTTTPIFANKIKQFNKNVFVFPNAIDPEDESFKITKTPCEKLRIGMVMGSSHLYDLYTMDGFVGKLPKEVLDKVVFVLCGFDTRGTVQFINPSNGQVSQRPIKPQESVWYEYEKILTNNYKNISPLYKSFLMQFISDAEYPYATQEGYLRKWTKPMDKYFQHYNDVDVLLAPLEESEFNRNKSQLKAIECAFSHTAFVGSNFGPYTLDLKNIFKKGGEIDTTGNAILIDRNRAHKDWAKTVEKLVKNPNLVKTLQDNLYNDYKEKYNLKKVTEDRVNFYKKIIENKK